MVNVNVIRYSESMLVSSVMLQEPNKKENEAQEAGETLQAAVDKTLSKLCALSICFEDT